MRKLLCIAAMTILALSAQAAPPKIPDVMVTDQDGKRSHLYSDLVHGHIVVVNFVFTSCTTICGPMGANFGRLQQLVGRDVRLISISIDPLDNPARLKAWSQRWGRGDHWTLVTGPQSDIDAIRKAFGVYTADFVNHSAITFIGNDRTGEWTRVDGLAPAAKIAQKVIDVASEENAR